MKNLLFYSLFLISLAGFSQVINKRTLKLMGSRFDITVVANNDIEANNYIDISIEEISRIERLISSWDPNSQTSLINNNAGIKPVKVDEELCVIKILSSELSGVARFFLVGSDILFPSFLKSSAPC